VNPPHKLERRSIVGIGHIPVADDAGEDGFLGGARDVAGDGRHDRSFWVATPTPVGD
jgi:hypothetical protein